MGVVLIHHICKTGLFQQKTGVLGGAIRLLYKTHLLHGKWL